MMLEMLVAPPSILRNGLRGTDLFCRIGEYPRGRDYHMKHRLELELDVITDLLPLELASKVAPLVREAVETVRSVLWW